jgi:hypothetical protein
LKQRRRRLIPFHLFSAILDWRKTRATWRSFFLPLLVVVRSLSLSLSYFLWTSIPHRPFQLFQAGGKRRAAAASILHRPFTLFQACGKRAIAAAHNRKREEIILFTRRKRRESKKTKKKKKKKKRSVEKECLNLRLEEASICTLLSVSVIVEILCVKKVCVSCFCNKDFVRRGGGIHNRSIAGCIIDDFRTCVFYLLLIIATILDRFREKGGRVCVCVCISCNKYALPKFFLMFLCFRRISQKVPEILLSRGIEALNCEERIVRLQLFSSSSFARLL